MSKEIDAGDLKLIDLFSPQISYYVDYYQREYKWTGHAIILLQDLVSSYQKDPNGFFFLGAYVVNEDEDRKSSYVIDGQQRLTTLTLLFLAIANNSFLAVSDNNGNISLKSRIISEVILNQDKTLKLQVESHSFMLNRLIKGETDFDGEAAIHLKTSLLARNYHALSEILSSSNVDFTLFYEWLKTRVQMVKIEAKDPSSSYTIFETMNDRGLRLASNEILKGYILSNIETSEERSHAKSLWDQAVRNVNAEDYEYRKILKKPLKSTDDFEPMDKFLEIFFKARYAITGWDEVSENGLKAFSDSDWESIRPSTIHRWARQNSISRLKVEGSKDFYKLIEEIHQYALYYVELLRIARGNLKTKFSYILLEEMGVGNSFPIEESRIVLLSSLDKNSSPEERFEIWDQVATYLDITWARSFWNQKSALEKGRALRLARELRKYGHQNSKIDRIRFLLKELKPGWATTGEPDEPYKKNKRGTLRFLLRLDKSLGDIAERPLDFENYLHKKGCSLEIEHILPQEPYSGHSFGGEPGIYQIQRERIGALTLLSKSINGSIQDKSPLEKVRHYSGNLLIELLKESSYDKRVDKLLPSQGIQKIAKKFEENKPKIKPAYIAIVDRSFITSQTSFYLELAKITWHDDRLTKYVGMTAIELRKKISENERGGNSINETPHSDKTWTLILKDADCDPGESLYLITEGNTRIELIFKKNGSFKIGESDCSIGDLESNYPLKSYKDLLNESGKSLI